MAQSEEWITLTRFILVCTLLNIHRESLREPHLLFGKRASERGKIWGEMTKKWKFNLEEMIEAWVHFGY